MSGNIKAANGTPSLPSYTFGSDQNSGFYRIGADNIGMTLNGSKVMDWSATGLSITGTLTVSGAIVLTTPLGTDSIADAAITTAKIADANVTSAKLAANAVVTAAITDANVTTSKILNANVTYGKIQNVTDQKLLGNFSGGAAAPSEYGLGNNLAKVGSNIDTKYGPKAWAEGTVSGGVLTQNAGFNCTVTRQSQGNYTCTFTAAMADANYAFFGSSDAANSADIFNRKNGGTKSTAAFQFTFQSLADGAGLRDPGWWTVVVLGN